MLCSLCELAVLADRFARVMCFFSAFWFRTLIDVAVAVASAHVAPYGDTERGQRGGGAGTITVSSDLCSRADASVQVLSIDECGGIFRVSDT
jgi:hypothetical protein